jgi:hypothetical protein
MKILDIVSEKEIKEALLAEYEKNHFIQTYR